MAMASAQEKHHPERAKQRRLSSAEGRDVMVAVTGDWLRAEMKSVVTETQAAHEPEWWVALGHSVTLPIPKDQQDALYRKLNRRFRAWTGHDIAHHTLTREQHPND